MDAFGFLRIDTHEILNKLHTKIEYNIYENGAWVGGGAMGAYGVQHEMGLEWVCFATTIGDTHRSKRLWTKLMGPWMVVWAIWDWSYHHFISPHTLRARVCTMHLHDTKILNPSTHIYISVASVCNQIKSMQRIQINTLYSCSVCMLSFACRIKFVFHFTQIYMI